MANFFKHLALITKHRHRVIYNGSKCGIFWHCLKHDLSKYSHREFSISRKNYNGHHSPVYEERLNNGYFSYICQHHTNRNAHHWEYWTDFFNGHLVLMSMPWKYATEYVCDMLSASYTYNPKDFKPETTLQYFLDRKDHYYMTKLTSEYVTWCLTRYAQLGFKGLKKKDTKAKYEELSKIYPKTETLSALHPKGELPSDPKKIIMQPLNRKEEP